MVGIMIGVKGMFGLKVNNWLWCWQREKEVCPVPF